MSKMTPEEMEARYAAMTPEEIDAEVARLRTDATRAFAHAAALKDHWRQERMRRANLRTIK